MVLTRMFLLAIWIAAAANVLVQWRLEVGFDPMDGRWWTWLVKSIVHPAGLPDPLLWPLAYAGIGAFAMMVLLIWIRNRAANRTLAGSRGGDELHGSAQWATKKDIRKSGLLRPDGVVVGGVKRWFGKTDVLRHNGPEHVMVFAPTRTGKGVSLTEIPRG